MGKNLFITHILLASLVVSLIVSCAHREADPDTRTNPFDPGSGKWTESTAPVITATVDSVWYDYNHSTASGKIRIHLVEDDLNFPYDTVVGSIFYRGSEIKLLRISSKKDTTLLLSGVKPDTTVQCTIIVFDSKQTVTSKSVNIAVPDSIPAMPPQARVINSSQQVTLTWPQKPNTNYVIYYSDSLKGPYSGSISVNQANNSSATVYNQPSGYFPRYYIVATINKFGTARSTDTLIGRRYYDGISRPSVSVSQGTYSLYIALSIYYSYSNLDYVEIYRSMADTSTFRLIKKVMTSGSGNLYYNDSVQTSLNYYYKVNVVDKQGRCSFPSTTQTGYLQRLNAPTLYINPSLDVINLSWTSVSGGNKYRIYRSPLNCIDSIQLLTETNLVSFTDTPPDSKLYYYSVSAVSNSGLEGNKSSCMKAKITILPMPDSIVVTTNYYPKHVALRWKEVVGADGYIIYRSNNNKDSIPLDTITNNSYNDTLPDNFLRYYRIAAYNNKGTGTLSYAYNGTPITPAFSNYECKNDSVFLTFTPNSRAIKYFVYSSSNKTDFTLLDSTTNSSYSASLKNINMWYYRFTIQTPEGISFPSITVSIIRQLSVPSNITIRQLVNGVSVEWGKVFGAEKYDIYRSTNSISNTFYRSTTDTFFIDTLPEGSPLYYYSLRSVNSATTSQISSKYQGSKINRPATPISISISGQLRTIFLSWSMSSISAYPQGFIIHRSTDNVKFIQLDSTQDNQYFDSVPDTVKYYYRISAYNAAGVSSPSQSYYASLAHPATPQNLEGTLATSKAHVQISWSNVKGISKYSIYRSLDSNGAYDYLRSVENANVYYDSSCSENITYFYKVAAITTDDQKAFSEYVTGIRLGPPTIAQISNNSDRIVIYWNRYPCPIQHFLIYRAEYPAGPYVKIDSTSNDSYSAIQGTSSYYYKISAFNVVESDLSGAASQSNANLSVSVDASEGTQTNSIILSWRAVIDVNGYRIYRAPTDSFNRNVIRIADVTSTTYTDNVTSDSIYYYKISALKPIGETGFSVGTGRGFRSPSTKPYPPQKPSATASGNSIIINWNPAPTSVGYNEYKIYKSYTSNCSYSWCILTIGANFGYKSLSWTDNSDLKSPATLWYFVRAVNDLGESVPSDTVSASY